MTPNRRRGEMSNVKHQVKWGAKKTKHFSVIMERVQLIGGETNPTRTQTYHQEKSQRETKQLQRNMKLQLSQR